MIVSPREHLVVCVCFSLPRAPPLSSLAAPRSSVQPPESSALWSASLLTCVRQLAGFYRSHRGMWSQTDATLLSVPPVPEGAGDYELIPSDSGPRGLREAPRRGSRLEVTLECLRRARCSSFVIGCSLRCCSLVIKMAFRGTLWHREDWWTGDVARYHFQTREEDELGMTNIEAEWKQTLIIN